MDKYLASYREMISLRGFTDHTMYSYSTYIKTYLDYLDTVLLKKPEDVSWQELRDYIFWLKKTRSLSDRTINHAISQLRFFTMYVLHKPWDSTQLPMRKFDTFLPYVPTQKEVNFFINSYSNIKHKAVVSLMYSSGLRVGEVCALRYEDISRSAMRIHIRHSKNRFDRYALLSKQALSILTDYWYSAGKPTGWLFPKQKHPDQHMVCYTVTQMIHSHEEELGWEHHLTCHSFRHAFATHLYENGTDLLTIKSLLGHQTLNATMIYVHLASNAVSDVISPFDRLAGDSIG